MATNFLHELLYSYSADRGIIHNTANDCGHLGPDATQKHYRELLRRVEVTLRDTEQLIPLLVAEFGDRSGRLDIIRSSHTVLEACLPALRRVVCFDRPPSENNPACLTDEAVGGLYEEAKTAAFDLLFEMQWTYTGLLAAPHTVDDH